MSLKLINDEVDKDVSIPLSNNGITFCYIIWYIFSIELRDKIQTCGLFHMCLPILDWNGKLQIQHSYK